MRKLSFVFFSLLLCASLALAEEGQASSSTEFLGKTINFILLFGSLAYFLSKPLRNFLQKRAREVERALKESQQSKQETARRLEEIKNRLANIKEEIEAIEKEGKIEGKLAKEKIIKEAHLEAARIKNFTQEEIRLLTLAGARELREYTAELVTAIALERIKKRMTPQAQSLIFNKSLRNIEKLYEKPNTNQEIYSGAN